jgi:tryptophan synthase alpha subunit
VSLLERAIVNLSGIIVRDSELDQLIQRAGEKKDILMEIGINFVRICKPLSLEKWTKVLELFSSFNYHAKRRGATPGCYLR